MQLKINQYFRPFGLKLIVDAVSNINKDKFEGFYGFTNRTIMEFVRLRKHEDQMKFWT